MKNILLLSLGILLALGCKKEEETTPPPPNDQVEDYLPIQIGNFWKYDLFDIAPDGTETYKSSETVTVVDVIVSGDTTFVELSHETDSELSKFLIPKDLYFLDGVLVSQNSNTPFLSLIQDDTLTQSVVTDVVEYSTYVNLKVTEEISVPAGDFSENLVEKIKSSVAIDPDYPHGIPRYGNTYFEKDLGIVWAEVFYFSSPNTLTWKLTEYELN